MFRRGLLAIATLALVVLPAAPCFACSCGAASPEEQARASEVIFTGVALDDNSREGSFAEVAVRFGVDAIYKGELEPITTITTNNQRNACGYLFRAGSTYTVFARVFDGKLRTSSCYATTEGEIEPAEYALPWGSPVAARPEIVNEREDAPTSSPWVPFAVVGATLLLAAAAIWLRRRERPEPRMRPPS